MQKMSDLSNCKKDPHFKPSTGASKKVAQNIQMSCHSMVDYDHVRMHAKPHPHTLSINQDIRGGPNVPPPREYDAKKRLVGIGLTLCCTSIEGVIRKIFCYYTWSRI